MTQKETLLCYAKNENWEAVKEMLQRAAFNLGAATTGKLSDLGAQQALWNCLRGCGIVLMDAALYLEIGSRIYFHDLEAYFSAGQKEAKKNHTGGQE